MKETDLAWAAGLFEGEGSIRINTPTRRNLGALLCDMVNTDQALVGFFQHHWGGYFRRVHAPAPRKSFWRWRIAALDAAAFLRDIRPYLRSPSRIERADLALEFQAHKSRSPRVTRTPEYRAAQLRFYERMKALNVRGVRRST